MLTAFDNDRLFGARHGTSDPWVLALPGWMRTNRDFDGVLADPKHTIDSIALDLPGFGSTPPPPEVWGSAEYARAVVPVLESMPGYPVVIGHSFGGRVAVHLAAAYPEHVSALVLTGVPLFRITGTRGKPPPGFRLARTMHKIGIVSEQRFEAARQRYGSPDYREAQGVMRGVLVRVLGEKYVPMLKAIRCPVELVWGDHDTAAPLEVAHMIQSELWRAHLTVCEGVGHMTPLKVPAELRAALERHRP